MAKSGGRVSIGDSVRWEVMLDYMGRPYPYEREQRKSRKIFLDAGLAD